MAGPPARDAHRSTPRSTSRSEAPGRDRVQLQVVLLDQVQPARLDARGHQAHSNPPSLEPDDRVLADGVRVQALPTNARSCR